ncbi:hypothetical protein [Acinetobacter sp. WZC-1]|uniref:hypothetical protein n=1 Tax=Acinetobacter sp. WZC-1 TaxID=3459034 RepID=UPI00403E01B5
MELLSEDIVRNLYSSISELEKIMISLNHCDELQNEKKEIRLQIAYAVTDLNNAIGTVFCKRPDLIPDELKHIDFCKGGNQE